MTRIEGVGIDLIEVQRVEKLLNNERFLRRCFTPKELEYCFKKRYPAQSLAARYAAKEAVGKALGTGIMNRYLSWQDVEILRYGGKPMVELHGKPAMLLKDAVFLLSITHTSHYAAAVVYFFCENFDEVLFKKSILT
jgi:holo-[acyl-carrier protein] synthase